MSNILIKQIPLNGYFLYIVDYFYTQIIMPLESFKRMFLQRSNIFFKLKFGDFNGYLIVDTVFEQAPYQF